VNWWEQPYKGGPMVKVAGFPRPLYPPDAARYGKKPSVDGPDVVAYKRTVSRAGRWPWQPMDDSMSNGFSHGTGGGNVGHTGVAGVQRQQHIDATGWIGKNTFNTLRSIRCPKGPHEGEMAMDAYSVELIAEAFDMFGGHEPDQQGGTLRARALELAQADVGYKESPAGSNQNQYGAWYGMNGQPWCAMACTYWYLHAGPSPSFMKGSRYAYVPYIVGDAYNGRYGLAVTDDPVAGDLVCYDWAFDGEYDHIGLFQAWQTGGNFWAVEGNTSTTSSDSNGGQVMQRTRNRAAQATVFVRVTEP
jgi:hypothetical protein